MAFKSQRVVILAGLPASGKTTLSTRLRELGFAWINQVGHWRSTSCCSKLTRCLEDRYQGPEEPWGSCTEATLIPDSAAAEFSMWYPGSCNGCKSDSIAHTVARERLSRLFALTGCHGHQEGL